MVYGFLLKRSGATSCPFGPGEARPETWLSVPLAGLAATPTDLRKTAPVLSHFCASNFNLRSHFLKISCVGLVGSILLYFVCCECSIEKAAFFALGFACSLSKLILVRALEGSYSFHSTVTNLLKGLLTERCIFFTAPKSWKP